MTDKFWKRLAASGKESHVKKDEVIYRRIKKKEKSFVYLLGKGICALSSALEAGDERVYLYFQSPRLIGFNHLVTGINPGGGQIPDFYIVAKTPCVLYAIEEQVFQSMIYTDTEFNSYLIEALAENYWELLVHMHRMYDDSAVSRLCRLLYAVSEKGCQGKPGRIPKFFTYEELASYLGSHTVTVSRIMAQLKKKGVIVKGQRGLEIKDRLHLKKIIDGMEAVKY